MQQQGPAEHEVSADGAAQGPFEALEGRVHAMAGALREAREAWRAADLSARDLGEQVRERDLEIARLKDEIGNDELRSSVRLRIESLIRRIDELERQD